MSARLAQLPNCTLEGGSSSCNVLVGMKYHSLHEHLVIKSVPVLEYELGGQARHELCEGAPAFGENVTAGQLVQVLACW